MENKKNKYIRLGVNIDHVATIRNARGGLNPDPLRAAKIAVDAGADVITIHLREDRRHVNDQDVENLIQKMNVPINLEIACTDEMINFAYNQKPNSVCLVPEKREEKTTEGGLDVVKFQKKIAPAIGKLMERGIKVALFIEPEYSQIEAAASIGVPVVELHTGTYSNFQGNLMLNELKKIKNNSKEVVKLGMECHAGHGLTFDNVFEIAKIKDIVELNIGHFLIGEAIFIGIDNAIKEMKSIILSSRNLI